MSTGSDSQTTLAEELSALVDGELHEAAVASACNRWRTDASARATWHAYQLIGDVLRSEDLATCAARDAAFLGVLRTRLAAEPVVLAPQAMVAPAAPSARAHRAVARRRWSSWMGPSAVAAGFVAVAGVLVVTRNPASAPPAQPDSSMAKASQASSTVAVTVGSLAGSGVLISEPQPLVADGRLIRDAGLDRYLEAHKHFAGSAALGVPSAFLRSATAGAPGR